MPIGNPLELRYANAIEDHNNILIAAADRTITKLRGIKPSLRDKAVNGQILYWEHVRSALQWATGVAKQRCPELNHVASKAV